MDSDLEPADDFFVDTLKAGIADGTLELSDAKDTDSDSSDYGGKCFDL